MSRTLTIALTPGRIAALAAGLLALLGGAAGASYWIARRGAEHDEAEHAGHDPEGHAEHGKGEHAGHDPEGHAEHGKDEHAGHDPEGHAEQDKGEHRKEGKVELSPQASGATSPSRSSATTSTTCSGPGGWTGPTSVSSSSGSVMPCRFITKR
jgi:hypothetical protein